MDRAFGEIDFGGKFTDADSLRALPKDIEDLGYPFNRLNKILGLRISDLVIGHFNNSLFEI